MFYTKVCKSLLNTNILPIFTGKTCIHCHGNSGGTEGLILKFWLENPVHIMKVDTTRFYRIVILTTKVKTLNMTRMSIEEVGRAVEKRSKPACQSDRYVVHCN